MDWNDLRYFLAVIEAGSLSAAAKRLHISQPTVGRRLAALEGRLGTRLVERRGRGFVLTPDGETLAASIRRMEDEALAAERRLRGRDLALTGVVRLSATEGIGAGWLPQRLRLFRARYPDIDIELAINNETANLSRREADIAIRMLNRPGGALPWQDALVGRALGTLRLGLYAAPDYLAANGTPDRDEALRGHAIVALDGYLAGASYDQWLKKASGNPRPALATNSLLAQLNAIRAGFGIGVISSVLARDDPGLVQVLADAALPAPEVWLVFHADLKASARIRAVIDFLAAEVAADPYLLAR